MTTCQPMHMLYFFVVYSIKKSIDVIKYNVLEINNQCF